MRVNIFFADRGISFRVIFVWPRISEDSASQWAHRATRVTLVQDVAQAYFQLRSPDPQI